MILKLITTLFIGRSLKLKELFKLNSMTFVKSVKLLRAFQLVTAIVIRGAFDGTLTYL